MESVSSFQIWGQSAFLALLGCFLLQGAWGGYCLFKDRKALAFSTFKAASWFYFMLTSGMMGALIGAYVTSDFSLKNVFENSHTQTPLLYKVTGAWGNHEGSMLLWLWLMSFYGVLKETTNPFLSSEAPLQASLPPHLARKEAAFVLGTQGIYQLLFILTAVYIYVLSNPFEAFQGIVHQGLELNPILQDPALAFHPPTLYAGYVGFGVVYTYALAGMMAGVEPRVWIPSVQKWTLVAWSFLTLGITLGSWWAYYELGWGGWWFWDPVENASLMPWLSATALMHVLQVASRPCPPGPPASFIKNTCLLGILTYLLCLLGTFLVRSGSLSSVHAFAQDPGRGAALLSFTGFLTLLGAVGGGLYFQGRRRQAQQLHRGQLEVGSPPSNQPPSVTLGPSGLRALLSIEFTFTLQMALFMVLLGTVVLGTIYPLILEALTGKVITVGAPYFHKTFVPISFLGLALMGVRFFPKRAARDGPPLQKSFKGETQLERPLLLTLLGMAVWSFLVEPFSWISLLGSGLSFWVMITSFKAWRQAGGLCAGRHHPVFLAHLGVGIMVFGMTADYSFRQEKTLAMGIGETVLFGDFTLTLKGVDRVREHTFMGERGQIEVRHAGRPVAILQPEKRFYPSHQVLTTETALYPHGMSNLYLALGGVLPENKWVVRAYHHPFVLCLWGGALLMVAGGLGAFLRRRQQLKKQANEIQNGDFKRLGNQSLKNTKFRT